MTNVEEETVTDPIEDAGFVDTENNHGNPEISIGIVPNKITNQVGISIKFGEEACWFSLTEINRFCAEVNHTATQAMVLTSMASFFSQMQGDSQQPQSGLVLPR